jgi:uncharacterized repeat protein (TIGR01451 family)
LSAGQTVYAVVDRSGTAPVSAPFEIQVTRARIEVEFNNAPANAEDPAGDGSLPPNSAYAGCPLEGTIFSFGTFTDIDFFTLGNQNGSRIYTQADGNGANPSSSSASGVNFDMRITNATDTLEFDDANNNSEFAGLSPNIAGRILPDAPAYLRINLASTTAAAEPYRLFTTIRPAGSGPLGTSAQAESAEPNDAFLMAGDYFYGFTENRGGECSDHAGTACTVDADCPDSGTGETCDAVFDGDFYAFCAEKGDQIAVNSDLDPTRNNTPYYSGLFLFLPSGPRVYGIGDAVAQGTTSSASDAPGAGLAATTPFSPAQAINYLSTQTGLYQVNVNGQSAAGVTGPPLGSGDYLVQMSLNCTVPSADMGIVKTGPVAAVAGQDITYTISVTNAGPNLATLPGFADPLPAGTTFVAVTGPPEWICDTPNVGDNGTVSCFELTTGCFKGSADFTITVHIPVCFGNGDITNTAFAGSSTSDPNSANDSSSAITTVTDPGTCNDGNTCTTVDICVAGVCTGTVPANCDDSNVCTDDSCDSVLGCQHVNNTAACDDGNSCTNGDACAGGSCVGTNAPAGQACTSDGNVCTTDACNGAGTCAHANNTLPCNDGNACTTNDTCGGGTCNGGAALDCNDGNVCTDDSCNPSTGCVNACNNTCNTKGQGYWKRLCHGPHSGDFYTAKDVDCVNNTCTFAGVTSIAQMCDKLDQHGGDKCAKAEEKFMSLLLNLCRCRVQPGQSINSRCGPHQTVAESVAFSDAALCNPGRTTDDCQHAECSSTEIQNGEALWANSLRISRVGQSIRLTWSPPYAQPDTETNYTYRIWRRRPVTPGQAPVAFSQVGTVHGNNLTYTDINAASGAWEYEITAD